MSELTDTESRTQTIDMLKNFIQEAVEKELDTMQFTHAMSCEKECGGQNEDECNIKNWWLEYKELVKKDGAAYLKTVNFT